MTQTSSIFLKKTDLDTKKEDFIKNKWWSELRHGGLFLSPAVLEEVFPDGPEKVEEKRIEKLYDAYIKYITNIEKFNNNPSKLSETLQIWIDAIFDQFLDLPSTSWLKKNNIPEELKVISALGEKLRPNRVLTYLKEFRYLIKIDKQAKTLGLGKSKREYAKFLDLLRKTKVQLGIYTNGHQIRLIYAGLDHDSWIEWDVERWFEDPIGDELIAGFFHLCGRSLNYKKIEDKWALIHYVQYSRIKQSDLSSVLGNQVREAVEILLENLDLGAHDTPELLDPLKILGITEKQNLNALYQAAIRIIMRLVVVFFAEVRELFPRSLERYDQSYSLEGLFRILNEAEQDEGPEILKNNICAWTRLLALFNLIYDGSPFSDIPIRPYGGVLFRPGNPESEDIILRALSIFQNPKIKISDYTILRILRKLKIGKLKIKKGRSSTWVHGPVDFSGLSAEYIGMIYEGLLDYQVRQVSPKEEAIVILKLGRQPALPITRLESLEDKELKDLIEKLSKEKAIQIIKDEDSDEEEIEEDIQEEIMEDDTEEEIKEEAEDEDFQTTQEELFNRALEWAKKAMEKAKIVKQTKNMSDDQYNQLLEQAAKKTISREGIYGEGQYYLIQNSGNRKGSGTFYTKPQLVIPTVQRILEPLVYVEQSDGRKVPKTPEAILSLRVCDPAMGSASFLVAALRYLSNVLYDSLLYNHNIKSYNSNKKVISIPYGKDATGELHTDTFTISAVEINERAELQIKSRLKRHIMENCIYGIDINSLAVELAKLSLWIETMDRDLPFNFIDHKLKVGNSMIGSNLASFCNYPLMAWEREAGDSNHNNGIKYKNKEWSKTIKDIKNKVIKSEIVEFIERLKGKTEITDFIEEIRRETFTTQNLILELYEELHRLDKFDITKVNDNFRKEEQYFKCFRNSNKFKHLKFQMDLWCSIWFWDPDKLNICPIPLNYLNPSEETQKYVRMLADKYKFFHWEIEFPDVFTKEKFGFDVILGNPPWETMQASSMEFFSEYDPIYRTYGKQVALKKQKNFFLQDKNIEREWLRYSSFFKFFKNWIDYLSNPNGDYEVGKHFNLASHWSKSHEFHNQWRNFRSKNNPHINLINKFNLQGSGKPYTYKIFTELAIANSSKEGRIGILLPASIYGDLGAKELREYLLDKTSLEYIFSFENRKKIFSNIHGSFKFCVLLFQKGTHNEYIETAFMRQDLADWENSNNILLKYNLNFITSFSPIYKIILEIENKPGLKILEKIYKNKCEFGGKQPESWGINFYREMNPTDDSKYFSPIPKWESIGYKKNSYDKWIGPNNDIAIPIYEGRMIGQFDFSKKGWVSGKGRTAVWKDISFEKKEIQPQFLISQEKCEEIGKRIFGYKASFMKVTSATNERTIIAFLDRDSIHIDAVPVLYTNDHLLIKTLLIVAILNSFIFDFLMRIKTSGICVNYFRLEETPLPKYEEIEKFIKIKILELVSKLSFIHIKFAPDWLNILRFLPNLRNKPWKSSWAITKYERLRLRAILDAIIAFLYNLTFEDFSWILKDDVNNPKGFWRVDKEDSKEIRLTSLTLKAFEHLNNIGIEKFCENEWQIPNEIKKKFENELGPQYLEWQLGQSVEESWLECEKHAQNILGKERYEEFNKSLKDGKDPFAEWAIEKEKERGDRKKNKKKSKKEDKAQKTIIENLDTIKDKEKKNQNEPNDIKNIESNPNKTLKQKGIGDFFK